MPKRDLVLIIAVAALAGCSSVLREQACLTSLHVAAGDVQPNLALEHADFAGRLAAAEDYVGCLDFLRMVSDDMRADVRGARAGHLGWIESSIAPYPNPRPRHRRD